ncbi:MAG TPA: hypothetical protein VFZ00_31505 [Solirubrobacter sp.]|nr:hypothetical protein [Solirubrobacter sp.]
MNITSATLTRTAGISATAAGALYVFIQFIHPEETLATVTTTGWIVTAVLTGLMALFALVGVTGMYVRQSPEMGTLGLIGYLLYGTFFLLVIAFSFVETFVLPALADDAPQFVSDMLALFAGGEIVGDLGALTALNPVAGVTYLLGGVLFGIALYRARILARWASLLLAAGAVSALAVQFVPHSVGRMAAIPVGVALVGLGYSMIREQRSAAVRGAQLSVAGAR